MKLRQVEKHVAAFCSSVGTRCLWRAVAVAGLGVLPGVSSLAATVGSPPFVGDDVVYEDVTSTGSVFSSPSINGNNLNFSTDSGFGVVSQGGGQAMTAPTVTATTGINSVVRRRGGQSITELGVLLLSNARFTAVGTGAAFTRATRVAADVVFSVDVLEAGGVALPAPVTLTGRGNIFDLNAVDNPRASPSNGTYSFDLATEAADAGIIDPVTRIDWGVTVTFTAESESPTPETYTVSRASFVGFDKLILTVPEPGAGLVLASSGGCLLARRRRA